MACVLPQRLLLLLLLISCYLPEEAFTLAGDIKCRSRDYCSLGSTTFFKGDISTSEGFKAALEAVSYKRELILVTITGSYYMEMLLQLRQDFEDLGMAHFLVLTMKAEDCNVLHALKSDASCVWDSSPTHSYGFSDGYLLWHLRWRFLARASRLQYNVMSLDSDTHINEDPYQYLKGYPMANVTLVGIQEHGCGMNGGFAYVQNARPDGPVSWMFRWVTELPLRWMDDDYATLAVWGRQKVNQQLCMTDDQSFLDDALHSTITGYHCWGKVIQACTPDTPGWRSPGPEGCTKEQCISRHGGSLRCHDHSTAMQLAPPSAWPHPLPPSRCYDASTIRLRLPNSNGSYFPERLGGKYFSSLGGKYSDVFMKQLNGDCPPEKCAWWPDERMEDRELAHSIQETFAFAPQWFWAASRDVRHGLATPIDRSRPRQVAVHAHATPGTSKNSKLAVRKLLSRFHWNLSRSLHKDRKVASKGPYFHGRRPAERVLLLHPNVDLSRTENHLEMKMIVQGLIQLALLSNRTLVYPDVPCEAGWMLEQGNVSSCSGSSYLSVSRQELFPYAALKKPWEGAAGPLSYRFVNAFLWEEDCFKQLSFKGMMNVEYEQQWLHVDAPSQTKKAPSDSNTVFRAGTAEKLKAPPQVSSPSWSLGEVIVTLSPKEAQDELRRLHAEPLLYVAHPVTVEVKGDASMLLLPPVWTGGSHMDWRQAFKIISRMCRGIYQLPWDYTRNHPGVIEDAARGLPGSMQGGVVTLTPGAAFPDGLSKPWVGGDLDPRS